MDQRLKSISTLIDELHAKYPDHGFKMHKSIEFATRKGAGVFVRATEPIQEEEILMVIPEAERITFANVATEDVAVGDVLLADLVKAIGEKVGSTITEMEPKDITLTVLIMYVLANETRFDSFVATWPSREELDRELMFDKDALSEMSGAYTEYLLTLNEKVLEKVYGDIVFPAIEKAQMSHLFVQEKSSAATTDELWGSFRHAFALANSRCHDGYEDGTSADVIPLVDLLNGLPDKSKDVNVALALGKWPFLRGSMFLNEFDFACSAVYAKRNLRAGEELLISYGEIPPCAFVYKYGSCPEQFLNERLTADPAALWYPPEMAAPEEDTNRIKALSESGFPTSASEIKQDLVFYLYPHELEQYSAAINGIGDDVRSYEEHEPNQLKVLRQYIILGVLADNDSVDYFLETKRLKGNFELKEIGRFLLQVVDYNLENLATDVTSVEELQLLDGDELSEREKSAIKSRICYRETLAQWRHVICRRYSIFSAADDAKPIRDVLDMDYLSVSTPSSLRGGGCNVCGRTLKNQRCSRCKQVSYCSKQHQRGHWKLHKPICVPVGFGESKK